MMISRKLLLGDDRDPYWSNVLLMIQPPSTVVDGSKNIIDHKGRTLTVGGDTQHDIYNGEPCVLFDGTGDFISTPFSSDFNTGTGDFCVEAIVQAETLPVQATIFFKGSDGNLLNSFSLSHTSSKPLFLAGDASSFTNIEDASTLPISHKVHIVGRRYGSDWALYVNGVKKATYTWAPSIGQPTINPCITVGAMYGPNNRFRFFNGRLFALRVTKGVARYTSDSFNVPPLPWPTS